MPHPLPPLLPHRVFGTSTSGNCHKVWLAMDVLGLPYRWHEVDILKGESRTTDFLAMNPNGRVPVLQIDDHTFLAESNAILWYFGEGTTLVPDDRLGRARMLQWMFFEQYSHEPAIAVARFIRRFLQRDDDPRLPELMRRGHGALAVMEAHLARQPFLAGAGFSIADIALFAYTHRAEEGGFDLASYPAVRSWLGRCLAQPGVSAMPVDPVCSMHVDEGKAKAAGKMVDHGGKTYFFCSDDCGASSARSPRNT